MTASTSSTAGICNGECVDVAGGMGSEKLDELGPVNSTFLEPVRDGVSVATPVDDFYDTVEQRHGVGSGSIAEHDRSQADSSSPRSFGHGPAGLVALGDGSRQLDSSILTAAESVTSADGVATCARDALCSVHRAAPVEDEPEKFRRVETEDGSGTLPLRRVEGGDAFWRALGARVDEESHGLDDGILGEENKKNMSGKSGGTGSTLEQMTSYAPSRKKIKHKCRRVAPVEDDPAKPPFRRDESGDDFWRALGARVDEEIDGFHDGLLDEKSNVSDEFGGNVSTFEQTSTASLRKRIKYKYCKAAIMALGIWSITGVLLSLTLGLEWYNHEGIYADGDLCTLCGKVGSNFVIDKMSSFPTRQPTPPPSTPEVTSPLHTLDPPPANLAQLCAPSIRLDHGSHFDGASKRDLIAKCMDACLPSSCCLADNREAREGLRSILGTRALTALSTASCYNGDDVQFCEAYKKWCSTLYSLDFVLEESLPLHFFDTCSRDQGEKEETSLATSRDCEDLCRPLACCHNIAVKRHREHKYHEAFNVSNSGFHVVAHSRTHEECQNFNADPINAEICKAYAPFCSDSPCERNDVPTQQLMGTQPSLSTAPSTSLVSTFQPSEARGVLVSLSPIPTLIPKPPVLSPTSSHSHVSSSSPTSNSTNHANQPTVSRWLSPRPPVEPQWTVEYVGVDVAGLCSLTLLFDVGVGRDVASILRAGDCGAGEAAVAGVVFDLSLAREARDTYTDRLALTYAVVEGGLWASNLWSADAGELRFCHRLHLTHPAIEGEAPWVIFEDKRVVRLGLGDFNTANKPTPME